MCTGVCMLSAGLINSSPLTFSFFKQWTATVCMSLLHSGLSKASSLLIASVHAVWTHSTCYKVWKRRPWSLLKPRCQVHLRIKNLLMHQPAGNGIQFWFLEKKIRKTSFKTTQKLEFTMDTEGVPCTGREDAVRSCNTSVRFLGWVTHSVGLDWSIFNQK